jgi:hypothetical protein
MPARSSRLRNLVLILGDQPSLKLSSLASLRSRERRRLDVRTPRKHATAAPLYEQFSEAENGRIKESAAAFLATLKPSAEWPWASHRVRFLRGKKNAAAKAMRARRRCFGGAARLPALTGRGPAVVSVFLPEFFA